MIIKQRVLAWEKNLNITMIFNAHDSSPCVLLKVSNPDPSLQAEQEGGDSDVEVEKAEAGSFDCTGLVCGNIHGQ